ncbi:MAG TPA: hypothetical protein VE715_20520 [Blastocatellia bacterium]|nr:hypothetical protein [Blastocatellia bacterium]
MINFVRSIAIIRHVWQRPSTNCVRAIALSFAATCALFPQTRAASDDPLRYRGGLRNSPGKRKLNAKQLDAVITSLRDKTGLLEMRFDENGFLTLGDKTKFSGGSATARALLDAAASMPHAVDLESHMYSSQVAFARLAKPVAYLHYSSGAKIDVFPLEIDFSDFSKLRGDQQALAAFDLGLVILHELGHTTLGLRDSVDDPEGLGECEALINRIRRELNLPERQTYVAQSYTASTFNSTGGSIRFAELVFARAVEKQGRMRIEKFNISWEASLVGPITEIADRGPKIEDRRSRTEDRMKVAREKSGVTFLPRPE